jgi:16S rRNA (guanine527-N7)-methyltransferase
MRAEVLGRRDGHRGRFDLVTARAVGSLAEVAELGLPLAAIGGRVVAWKRDDGSGRLDDEIGEAQAIIRQAGGVLESVEQVDVPGLEDHRLVLLVKRRETPARFPRAPEARRRRARP